MKSVPGFWMDDMKLPESLFLITDRIVIFDHLSHSVKIVVCADMKKEKNAARAYASAAREIDAIVAQLKKPLKAPASSRMPNGVIKGDSNVAIEVMVMERARLARAR